MFFSVNRAELVPMTSARESALMINNATQTSVDKLESVAYNIYTPVEGASYAHHPHITKYKNKFYAIYSLGKKNEEDIGQKMMLSVSSDAENWSEPTVLADIAAQNGTNSVVIPAGLYSTDNMLIAYYGSYDYRDDCLVYDEDGNALRPADENVKKTNWKMYAAYTADGINWTHLDMDFSPACNYGPFQTKSGRLIITGGLNAPYSDDISGLSGWQDSVIDPSETVGSGEVSLITEGAVYQLDNGILRMLFRTDAGVLYCSESYDDGMNWTCPYPTNFVSDTSKFAIGRLNNGTYFWIGNPDGDNDRTPLSVCLSKDGVNFDRRYIIRDETYDLKFSGLYKGGVYGYPSYLVDDGYLYIIYSKHKESIEVTKILLADLKY